MKKLMSFTAVAAAAALSLTACSGGSEMRIGISQLVSHPSLDAAAEGFKDAFEDAGIKVKFDEKNANGDLTVAANIAGAFASDNTELVLAIATPAAEAVRAAVVDKPTLFTAVTDPVIAGLVDSLEAPGGNMTGTSDANPVYEQLDLIRDIVPGVKTVGIIYSPGEANSVVQVEWAKEAAEALDLELQEAPAATSQEVLQAAESLSNVDAIYVPTDNIVVTALETVLKVGEDKHIPVFGAEGDTVHRGAIATYGLNYYDLGKQTGAMAIAILVNGADPATMPVEFQPQPMLYLNLGAAERMGVEIPADLIAQADPANITE